MIKLKTIMENKEQPPTKYVICPFCGETDFDLIGLKTHLNNGDCDVYNNTEELKRLF